MKLLLDANVAIDLIGNQPSHFGDAASIVAMYYFDEAELYISAQSVTDVFYVLTRSGNPSDAVQDRISNFCEVVQPISLTAKDLQDACALHWNDMSDCLVSLSATKIGADYIVTRDVESFARSSIPAITPQGLLEKLRG